jgi:hypothetical protein
MILKPAELVIEAFGGVRPLARLLGKSPSTVCRWRADKPHGTGGAIPSSVQKRLLYMAGERGIELTAQDLIVGRTVPAAKA